MIDFSVNTSNNAGASTTGVLINLSNGSSTAGQELIDVYSSNQYAVNSTRGGGGIVNHIANLSAASTNFYGKAVAYGAAYGSAAAYKLRAVRIA